MCGIIGYVGKNNAVPYLIKGLERLEYRGYDSAGIALAKAGEIFTLKRQGKICQLKSAVSAELYSLCGIGHTRWATHGNPSRKNAHPHLSSKGSFAVVHNGIIENSDILKEGLINEGYHFASDTDTEVISQLLEKNYKGDVIACLCETTRLLEGAYALASLHKDYPDTIFCAKKDSPLLISSSSQGSFVFSDSVATAEYCENYYSLCDCEFAEVTESHIRFFDSDGNIITKTPRRISDKADNCCKKGFPHYMLKEIYEQPYALKATLDSCITDGNICFPLAEISADLIGRIDKIYMVGCGSAYHAGVYGKYIMEELTGICTTAEIASEFRYGNTPLGSDSLVVVISQSGETADSIAALKKAVDSGANTLSIINSQGSTMSELSHMVIYTMAGTEVSVATTKAYLCQNAVLYLLALYIGEKSGRLTKEKYNKLLGDIMRLPEAIKTELRREKDIIPISHTLTKAEHIYFIGRGTDYALSLEGALKLKEISYIHCEAYPAGELKHGTLSLIEKNTPVVALCLRSDIFKKTLSGIKEVKARGGRIIAVTKKAFASYFDSDDTLITIDDDATDSLSLLSGAVSLQLLSYHTAVNKGCEVDKPRNLAKSVTVE